MAETLQTWLDARPRPAVAHETDAEGRTVLLRPKFVHPWLQWLQRGMRKPLFRVKLDGPGACLWSHMDGARTVAELAELQRVAFGASAEPAEERAVHFVRELVKGGFATLG